MVAGKRSCAQFLRRPTQLGSAWQPRKGVRPLFERAKLAVVGDSRRHRGPHPEDEHLFSREAVPRLKQAVDDLSWLRTRGYAESSATKLVGDRYDALRAWVDELSEFWALLAGDGIHPKTQEFVTTMVTRAVTDPAGMVDDPVVEGQLRDREILLKSKRARLAHRSALENWNQAPFGGQLDYRWGITQSYLVDLADGLEAAG